MFLCEKNGVFVKVVCCVFCDVSHANFSVFNFGFSIFGVANCDHSHSVTLHCIHYTQHIMMSFCLGTMVGRFVLFLRM